MTPDEMDALLQQLPPPSPSPGLRERVLADLDRRRSQPSSTRKLAWGIALAASLAGFAAVVWVILPGPSSDARIGRDQDGKRGDLKFAQVQWERETKGREITRTTLSSRQLFFETRDGLVNALDRFTGTPEWVHQLPGGSPPDWPPAVAQGVAEEIQQLEADLKLATRKLDQTLQEKGPGPEVQALQRKRNEIRERIRVAGLGDNVYLLSRQVLSCVSRTTGALLWTNRLAFVPSGPPFAIRGFLFVPEASAGRLRVLDVEKKGAEVRTYPSRAEARANPSLGGPVYADPSVYFIAPDGTVHSYRVTDGALVWIFEAGPGRIGGPVVHHLKSGGVTIRLLLFSVGRNLYAMDGNAGKLIWKTDCGAPLDGGPVLVGEGVYARTEKGDVLALEALPGGRIRWRQSGCERFLFKGKVDAYVLGANREILAVDDQTGEVSGRYPAGSFAEFLGQSSEGLFYAVRPGAVVCFKEKE